MSVVRFNGPGGPKQPDAAIWVPVGLQVAATGHAFLPRGSNHCLPFSPWLRDYLLQQPGANDAKM